MWLDPVKLRAARADRRRTCSARIGAQNLTTPGGTVDTGPTRADPARPGPRRRARRRSGSIVVRQSDDHPIRVADVARVEDGEEEADDRRAPRRQADRACSTVRKQSGANTVAVVDAVRERLADVEKHAARRLQARASCATTRRVDPHQHRRGQGAPRPRRALRGAGRAALPRQPALSTVIAAIAIPISIIGTFALMWIEGFTLNMITLLALALAVGIVIDDAIVVLENIYRFIDEKGYKPFPAAVAGDQGDRPGGARDHAVADGGVPAGRVHGRHRRPLPRAASA